MTCLGCHARPRRSMTSQTNRYRPPRPPNRTLSGMSSTTRALHRPNVWEIDFGWVGVAGRHGCRPAPTTASLTVEGCRAEPSTTTTSMEWTEKMGSRTRPTGRLLRLRRPALSGVAGVQGRLCGVLRTLPGLPGYEPHWPSHSWAVAVRPGGIQVLPLVRPRDCRNNKWQYGLCWRPP